MGKFNDVGPIIKCLLFQGLVGFKHLNAFAIIAHHPPQHVGFKDLAHFFAAHLRLHFHTACLICTLQHVSPSVLDQSPKRSYHDNCILDEKTIPRAVTFKSLLHIVGCICSEECCLRLRISSKISFQSHKGKMVLLQEEILHNISE